SARGDAVEVPDIAGRTDPVEGHLIHDEVADITSGAPVERARCDAPVARAAENPEAVFALDSARIRPVDVLAVDGQSGDALGARRGCAGPREDDGLAQASRARSVEAAMAARSAIVLVGRGIDAGMAAERSDLAASLRGRSRFVFLAALSALADRVVDLMVTAP